MKFPITYGLQKVGLPLILTSGKLKNLCFLIDTGSTHNVIFDFVFDFYKDEFTLIDGNKSIMGIEGKLTETLTIEATFNFDEKDYTSTFSVLNASEAVKQIENETRIQIHGIIGIEFLLENRWVIDFNDYTVKEPIKDNGNNNK